MSALSLAFLLGHYASRSTAYPATGSACSFSNSITWDCCNIFGYNDTLDTVKPQCGYVTVPADYKNCAAGSVSLAVVRRPATVEPRLGSLFVNPGGPGGSGITYVLGFPELGNITGNQHDIVSWDPRGVGYTSLQINCFNSTDEEAAYFQPDSILSFGAQAQGNFTNTQHNDPDEVAFWKKENETDSFLRAIMSDCTYNNGINLTYVGTAATVRDMLSLSKVIDGPRKPVNYWGVSYGTVIGSYFVNMFPDRVGKVILDGVVDPISWAQRPQYKSWPKSIADVTSVHDEFTRSCAEAGPNYCAIAAPNSTQADIAAWLQNLMDFVYDHPLGNLTSALARARIFGMLYKPLAWADSAKQLLQAYQVLVAAANASSMVETPSSFEASLRPWEWYLSPQALKIHSPRLPTPNSPHDSTVAVATWQKRSSGAQDSPLYDFGGSTIAIACGDGIDTPNTTTAHIFGEIVYTASMVSQMFGPEWFPNMYCHRWYPRAVERFRGPWNHKLANKILVIGNKGDPITPLANAKKVAELLGPSSAVLLERDGYGHSSLAEESTCTSHVITTYMVHGQLPVPRTVCATNKNYFGLPNVSNSSSGSWIGSV